MGEAAYLGPWRRERGKVPQLVWLDAVKRQIRQHVTLSPSDMPTVDKGRCQVTEVKLLLGATYMVEYRHEAILHVRNVTR